MDGRYSLAEQVFKFCGSICCKLLEKIFEVEEGKYCKFVPDERLPFLYLKFCSQRVPAVDELWQRQRGENSRQHSQQRKNGGSDGGYTFIGSHYEHEHCRYR